MGLLSVGGAYDGGVAFELSPASDGLWTETVLHDFGSEGDGAGPECNLIVDSRGNLYGTTVGGGAYDNAGTVFELSPTGSGWVETILYSFQGGINGPGPIAPVGGLVGDDGGQLYGVATSGGQYGNGAVYELAPQGTRYREKTIYSFEGDDGSSPNSGLTLAQGHLYGTTSFGGSSFAGAVFELTRDAEGLWTEQVLQSMDPINGASPQGPVVFDRSGNLYATASTGGGDDMGSVFMLAPSQGGKWTETVLHSFDFKFPGGEDGEDPQAGVILAGRRIFGTTAMGGSYDRGIVFELTPSQSDYHQ